jgi:hypothetical protein
MPLEFDRTEGNIVVVRASGKLSDEDYDLFVPRMEKLIEQWGRLRMLFIMEDFGGWDAQSAWNELKFQLRHGGDVKKVAVVGEKTWARWAAGLSRFFTGTDVRYFDRSQADAARAWIEEGW